MQQCSSHKHNAFVFIPLVWQLGTYVVLDPTRKLYNHKQINHSLKLVQCICNCKVYVFLRTISTIVPIKCLLLTEGFRKSASTSFPGSLISPPQRELSSLAPFGVGR